MRLHDALYITEGREFKCHLALGFFPSSHLTMCNIFRVYVTLLAWVTYIPRGLKAYI